MRCFYVMVHGRLHWNAGANGRSLCIEQPAGFYCHRYIFASDPMAAREKAFDSVTKNFDAQTGWLSDKTVSLTLEAEEIVSASFMKGFLPTNQGHTFYSAE